MDKNKAYAGLKACKFCKYNLILNKGYDMQIFKTDCTIAISIFNVVEIHVGKFFVKMFINA